MLRIKHMSILGLAVILLGNCVPMQVNAALGGAKSDAPEGMINPTDKVRGEKKAIACLMGNMKKAGYHGGKVYIDHCYNEESAENLKKAILAEFPQAEIKIDVTTGLCSYYAEKGGLMIGFER